MAKCQVESFLLARSWVRHIQSIRASRQIILKLEWMKTRAQSWPCIEFRLSRKLQNQKQFAYFQTKLCLHILWAAKPFLKVGYFKAVCQKEKSTCEYLNCTIQISGFGYTA